MATIPHDGAKWRLDTGETGAQESAEGLGVKRVARKGGLEDGSGQKEDKTHNARNDGGHLSPTDIHRGKFSWKRGDGYQIVASCLQLRIFASLVTKAIPSASAVAPIKRSHGSLE